MTPHEQQLLEDFLGRLSAAQGVAKDAQADALIHQRLAGQPDATYLLVQRALLLERALENARAQIAQLQASAAGQNGSFLGDGFGQSAPAGHAYPPPMPMPTQAPSWRERLFGAPPTSAPTGSGFLGSAMRTAAGVAGGMFLFDGIENLLGSHHVGGFLGGAPQETVVENVTNVFDNGNGLSGQRDEFSSVGGIADSNLDDANFDDFSDTGFSGDDSGWI